MVVEPEGLARATSRSGRTNRNGGEGQLRLPLPLTTGGGLMVGKEVAEAKDLVHTSIIGPVVDKVQTLPCGIKRGRSLVSGEISEITCTGCLEALGAN